MANDNKTLELQIRVAAQEAIRTVTSLKGEVQILAAEAQKFAGKDGAALNKSFKDAEAAAKDTVSGIGGIRRAILNLAEVAVAAKALSVVKDMGAFALQTADNFQTMRNQFGVLLGDMEAGAGLFNEIKAFNDKTPFDLSTLTQATNVLISAKVPLQDLQAQLTKFGDLSQGNSQRLTSYVNAFSQAAAKGKADMQVLNTYLHQGVPILDALAKNFGVTTAEIVKMSSDGQISFADFSRALEDLTAAGGQYFGGMELASKSLAAMQEGLREATNSLAASFGEMLLPVAIAIVSALTDITNAINESPILKGLLIGAIVALTGYLAAMAVKAGIAFAAQMSLNFAIGALNPVVLAATVAAAGMAAAYTTMASRQQNSAREAEDFALALKKESNALNDAAGAARNYAEAFNSMGGEDIARKMIAIEGTVNRLSGQIKEKQQELEQIKNRFIEEGRDFLIFSPEVQLLETEIGRMNLQLERGKAELNAMRQGYNDFRAGIYNDTPLIDDAAKKAAEAAEKWHKEWAEQYRRFQAEQSGNPFALMEIELDLKLSEANTHEANSEIIKQITEYYAAESQKIIKQINDEEKRLASSLTKTKIDDLEYQLEKELEAIDTLEQKKIFAAAYTEEEIARIQKRFEDMREDARQEFTVKINTAKLDEAREAVKDWQQELSDSLTLALMDIEGFSSQAAVILGDLSAQLIELSASAALSGFEEFGRALGEGQDAAESMERALSAMAEQILKQLPMMFLQAGLQLIANGQWPLGLGFIAAAGSTAIVSGYVGGATQKAQEASKNAHGNIFDEYSKAARAFADGGTFTNQIVNAPTLFRHGGGLGLMGEAGPEAIMPLTRMPNGDLGVQTAGGGTQVTVNIINNTGAEARQEESDDGMGGKQIDVIIGEAVNRHLVSGKADRALGGRYGLRAAGV
jgi:tape measure domain-containing protein